MQFAVGFKVQGKTGHVIVDAEDALVAALKVKMQRPEVLIAYVRQQNKRGDTRHPMRRLTMRLNRNLFVSLASTSEPGNRAMCGVDQSER